MSKLLKKIKHEMIQVFWVSLYFFFAFGFILFLKILFLSQYNIDFFEIGGVIVGALIMGKAVPLLNLTKIAHAFKKKYLILNILFKTVIYSIIADSLYFLEHVLKHIGEQGGFVESFTHAIEHPNTNQVILVISCTFITLLIFNLFNAINESLGEKGLYKLFFKPRDIQPNE